MGAFSEGAGGREVLVEFCDIDKYFIKITCAKTLSEWKYIIDDLEQGHYHASKQDFIDSLKKAVRALESKVNSENLK